MADGEGREGERSRRAQDVQRTRKGDMTSVVTYVNNDRQCFCQMKFDSGERLLISMAGRSMHSTKVIRMAFGGLIPRETNLGIQRCEGRKPRCLRSENVRHVPRPASCSSS